MRQERIVLCKPQTAWPPRLRHGRVWPSTLRLLSTYTPARLHRHILLSPISDSINGLAHHKHEVLSHRPLDGLVGCVCAGARPGDAKSMRLDTRFAPTTSPLPCLYRLTVLQAVVVSYPKDTPQSVIDQAMEAIKKAVGPTSPCAEASVAYIQQGGIITHEYSIIKGEQIYISRDQFQ